MTTHGLGENTCKQCYQTHKAKYKKEKQNKNKPPPPPNEQKTYIDISPEKTYRWSICI